MKPFTLDSDVIPPDIPAVLEAIRRTDGECVAQQVSHVLTQVLSTLTQDTWDRLSPTEQDQRKWHWRQLIMTELTRLGVKWRQTRH